MFRAAIVLVFLLSAPAIADNSAPAEIPAASMSQELLELKTQRAALAATLPATDQRLLDLDTRIDTLRFQLGARATLNTAALDTPPADQPRTAFPRIVPPRQPDLTAASGSPRGSVRFADESDADYRTRQLLERTISVQANSQPLEKVLNHVRDKLGANVFINWPALTLSGVDRNTPVTLHVIQVPTGRCLQLILDQVGGTSPLRFTIVEGVIHVSTQEDITSQKYQRVAVYDVRDIVDPPAWSPRANGRRSERVRMLMNSIRAAVAADSWRDTEDEEGNVIGTGTIGAMREINGHLVVNQTAEYHREIHAFLKNWRAATR